MKNSIKTFLKKYINNFFALLNMSLSKKSDKSKTKKEIITKHDKKVCGRRNTRFLEDNCSPNCNLGFMSRDDVQLTGTVTNSLRQTMERDYRYRCKKPYRNK